MFVCITIIGVIVALVVSVLHISSDVLTQARLDLIMRIRAQNGLFLGWLVHLGFALAFATIGFAAVLLCPHAKGSGIPQLIAYLNGCKIKGFTSVRTLVAKLIGTICALCGGFYCGPEGPIIHMGGCIGKLLLRTLYYAGAFASKCGPVGRSVFGAFMAMRNDLDERDFVAVGTGAGVSAAFLAPISGTLFVAEEAATHFSLSLLWRAFGCAVIALWASHWITLSDELAQARGNRTQSMYQFQLKFGDGTGSACTLEDTLILWVALLAGLGGLLGALLNHFVLLMGRFRRKVYGESPTLRRRAGFGAMELLILSVVSSSVSVILPELASCRMPTISQLMDGVSNETRSVCKHTASCAPPFGQCAGIGHPSLSCPDGWTCHKVNAFYSGCEPADAQPLYEACMPEAMREQIMWSNPPLNTTCDSACMEGELKGAVVEMLNQFTCSPGEYNDLASLLLQPSEKVVKALFIRGAPNALCASSLGIALVAWFALTVLTAGAPMSLGLMIPMIVIGGCLGRLFALVLRAVAPTLRFSLEPSIFALIGATSLLAGSGQIRLFLTVVMLEITDQLHLVPFVALAAAISVIVAEAFSSHGLYHALIHQQGLPYLPLDRPVDYATTSGVANGETVQDRLVADVMAAPLVTVNRTQRRREIEATVLATETHNAFPVVDTIDGSLDGLLLRSEVLRARSLPRDVNGGLAASDDDDITVEKMMCRAPACVGPGWPLVRAHRLFTALGLRHLLVVNRHGQPVGMLTRSDLQREHTDSSMPRRGLAASTSHADPLEGSVSSAPSKRVETAGGTPEVYSEAERDAPVQSGTR